MAGKGIIEMSVRELRRLKVVQKVIDKQMTQKIAASVLSVSERQIRRLIKGVRKRGDESVVHQSRGRGSNRTLPKRLKAKVLKLYRKRYSDFGPTLAVEKLLERDGIQMSDETLRGWLLEAGLWEKKRKRSSHRQWRQRRDCFGEMVQMDGSHHDWLEGRGPKLVLMGYIDDATSRVFAKFYDYEGTLPAMESFKQYIQKYGVPMAVYVDRHSTYKSSKDLTVEEELAGVTTPLSQFQRALQELGVKVIHALSPQAKGRVERLFGVLQDRLVKEMRLEGIKTKEGANVFLEGYLPMYNARFEVCPANATDAHVTLSRGVDLDRYLCIKEQRTVRNDNTVSYEGKLYLIHEGVNAKKVMIEERLDGVMVIRHGKGDLKYREITERPVKASPPARIYKTRVPSVPPKDHPWRKPWPHREVAQV